MHIATVARALIIACLFASPAALADEAPKTGSFETTFTERSPLSEMKSLTKRLASTDASADYNISAEPCLVFVPETYNPDRPMGLFVLLNYKASGELPTPVLPQVAEANCALVVPKNFGQPVWARVGIALDVAHNMAMQYKIDPRRVYVFSGELGCPAQRASLNYSEVFTGGVWANYEIYRAVKTANGAFWNAKLPRPDPKAMAVAKTHPMVLVTVSDTEQ
jgi:hypothetical protein